MFHRLLALPGEVRESYDVSSLRFVIHGAARARRGEAAADRVDRTVVVEYYARPRARHLCRLARLARPSGTVGKPLVDKAVIVADEDGWRSCRAKRARVPARRGAARFAYYGDEEKTSAAFRGEYFTLGDVGYLDEDGYLFLTDRSSNLIISGGVNIYPAEVDAVLLEHESVADVAVIGVPNDEWGEEVKAVVELRAAGSRAHSWRKSCSPCAGSASRTTSVPRRLIL